MYKRQEQETSRVITKGNKASYAANPKKFIDNKKESIGYTRCKLVRPIVACVRQARTLTMESEQMLATLERKENNNDDVSAIGMS